VFGLMAVVYLAGLLGTSHHLFAFEHHNHGSDQGGFTQFGTDHSHPTDDTHGTHPQATFSITGTQVDTCCRHDHDALPSVLPIPGRDLKAGSEFRSLLVLVRNPLLAMPAPSSSQFEGELPCEVWPGIISVAAGRAPPVFLHT